MKTNRSLKLALAILFIGQVIIPGYITGMDTVNSTWESVKTSGINFYNNPIKTTTKGAFRAAKYTAPFAIPAAAAYDVLWSDIMPNWISWPIAGIATYAGYQAIKDTPAFKAVVTKTKHGLSQAGEALEEEGVHIDEIASTVVNVGTQAAQVVGAAINPTQTISKVYKLTRDAGNVIASDFHDGLARAGHEAVRLLEDNADEMRAVAGRQLSAAARDTLGIPANQSVDASAVAQRINNAAYKSLWKFGSTGAFLTAAAPIAVITAWFSGKYIMHKVTQKPEPKVFRATSDKTRWERFKNWALGRTEHFPEMIYSPALETRLNNITKATININEKINQGKTNVFYRNILLEGPPGTGKTYFARNMIRRVNEATNGKMQWRETDGSALLKGGISAIDEMFEWAEKQTGVTIFIDEADTLFVDRDQLKLDSEQTIVLNHLLNRLGDRSNKYMIIMATNRKIVFDAAMQRRIDDLVEVPLPAQNERARVLQLYRNTILLDEKENSAEFVASAQACLTDEKIKTIAQGTQGLSNGDLQGIMTTIKSEADITDSGLVTNVLVDEVVQRYVAKHQSMNTGKNKTTATTTAIVQPNNKKSARRNR
ncbi:MAG TPA: AAA family ATPase [Candidatus Dependentiae bacterium]|nr:AAA family ATPase [Candidatus Dependentiae bacterium]HRQ62242.1 AAA family ATPase [Candidatus Dependentiae bacterium]